MIQHIIIWESKNLFHAMKHERDRFERYVAERMLMDRASKTFAKGKGGLIEGRFQSLDSSTNSDRTAFL
jgi:hypothetical protein